MLFLWQVLKTLQQPETAPKQPLRTRLPGAAKCRTLPPANHFSVTA